MHSGLIPRLLDVPRRLLLGSIRLYRRRLSGRGPLSRLRCTFERCESCSAFGERVARGSQSTLQALARIAGRLRRCRHLSLYRLRGGALGGGRGYDRWRSAPDGTAAAVHADLERHGELEPARDAVAVAATILEGGGRAGVARGQALLVRDGVRIASALSWRWQTRALASLVAWGLAWVLVAWDAWLAAALVGLVGVLTASSAWSARGLLLRLERLEVLAGLESAALAAPGGPQGE